MTSGQRRRAWPGRSPSGCRTAARRSSRWRRPRDRAGHLRRRAAATAATVSSSSYGSEEGVEIQMGEYRHGAVKVDGLPVIDAPPRQLALGAARGRAAGCVPGVVRRRRGTGCTWREARDCPGGRLEDVMKRGKKGSKKKKKKKTAVDVGDGGETVGRRRRCRRLGKNAECWLSGGARWGGVARGIAFG